MYERFRTINKEKHSIHVTVRSDSEMKRSFFVRDFCPLLSSKCSMLYTKMLSAVATTWKTPWSIEIYTVHWNFYVVLNLSNCTFKIILLQKSVFKNFSAQSNIRDGVAAVVLSLKQLLISNRQPAHQNLDHLMFKGQESLQKETELWFERVLYWPTKRIIFESLMWDFYLISTFQKIWHLSVQHTHTLESHFTIEFEVRLKSQISMKCYILHSEIIFIRQLDRLPNGNYSKPQMQFVL